MTSSFDEDRDGQVQDQKTASALADTARMTGAHCPSCKKTICGHEAVFSLVLGYKNAPRCLICIAAHMHEAASSLKERTLTYVQHHECFQTAWLRASKLEGFADAMRPACLWQPGEANAATGVIADTSNTASNSDEPNSNEPNHHATSPDSITARWDAGGMGCGDLVLELRLRLRELLPGDVMQLTATDAGAPLDLPAWCGLTGHKLLDAQHPVYQIRRKA